MQSHNIFSLIKSNTCFKGISSCINLTLTNRIFCFKNSSTFETGPCDHHHLIYSTLKTTFRKEDSKRLIYHDYKNFNNEYFENDLKNGLSKCPKNYKSFENVFVTVLDRYAPRKTKILSGNEKPRVDKNLRIKQSWNVRSWNLREIKQNQKIFQITEWSSCETEDTKDQLTDIIDKYKRNPSIKKIKSNFTIKKNFLLSQLLLRILKMLLKIFLLTKLLVVKFL